MHKQYSAETCCEYYILVAEERGLAVKEARSCCNYVTNQEMVMMMCIFLQASIAIEKMCTLKISWANFYKFRQA